MFDNIKADLRQGRAQNHIGRQPFAAYVAQFLHLGTQSILVYRFGQWALKLPIPIVKHVLLLIYIVLKFFVHLFAAVNIPTSARIGPGLVIHTWSGVYLPSGKIGKNCTFQHGVVVAYATPEIGDDVYFGPGAKVIKPVRIGNRARIGANAVVLQDVPDDCTAVGIPARIVPGRKPVEAPAKKAPESVPTQKSK